MRTAAAPALLAGLCLLLASALARGQTTQIGPGEEVEFFATDAVLEAQRDVWVVPLHARIAQRPAEPGVRLALLRSLSGTLRLPADSPQSALFAERARAFLADAEQDEHLVVAVAGQTFRLTASAPDGHVRDTIELQNSAVAAPSGTAPAELDVSLVLPVADRRRFEGRIRLLPPEGLSVIADIDDALVLAEVAEQDRMLARSFLQPFEAQPGMAALCTRAAAEGAAFHYVSGTPWQLHAPLAEFMDAAGFPRGSLALSEVRWSDQQLLESYAHAQDHKVATVATIAMRFPGRNLILLGDADGRDPECFGEIARRIPGRIERILIRDAHGGKPDDERYVAAFRGVAPERWTLFAAADELTTLRAATPLPAPAPAAKGSLPTAPVLPSEPLLR